MRSLTAFWETVKPGMAAAERWLLPPACLLCNDAVPTSDGDALVCGLCRSRWHRLSAPLCRRCGQPWDPGLPCQLCENWPPGFELARSAVWLDDSARRAVHLLKYESWWRLTESMALVMRDLISPKDFDILIPIPLSKARMARRGYNQSALLARELGAYWNRRVVDDGLLRVRHTVSQTELEPSARVANMVGVFSAGKGFRDSRVVLVDDVFTTGATLQSAASALIQAGVPVVWAVTFARARRPLDSLLATATETEEQ